jgi:hypothetical protein
MEHAEDLIKKCIGLIQNQLDQTAERTEASILFANLKDKQCNCNVAVLTIFTKKATIWDQFTGFNFSQIIFLLLLVLKFV